MEIFDPSYQGLQSNDSAVGSALSNAGDREMKKSVLMISLLCPLLVSAACTTYSFDAFRAAYPVQMDHHSNQDYTVKRKFEICDKAGWILGLIAVNEPAGSDDDYLKSLVAHEVRRTYDLDHDRAGVMNLEIEVRSDVIDYLLWLFPWYATETVVITGEVVEYDEPQAAGQPRSSDPPLLVTQQPDIN